MDLTQNKPCIISAGIGGWYGAGIDRMVRSLIFNGWAGDIMTWKEPPPGAPHPNDYPYSFKPYAFKAAFEAGHKVVIWVDASFWCVRNPMELCDYVNENGLYFFKSGYALRETASDALVNYAGVTREELTEVSEFATGCVGINIDNPLGSEFFNSWMTYCEDNQFRGNRWHDDADSTDPMFKFSRQDQSAASMILYKMGVKTAGETNDWITYKNTNYDPERVMWFIEGL